jgi:hypothetical protein
VGEVARAFRCVPRLDAMSLLYREAMRARVDPTARPSLLFHLDHAPPLVELASQPIIISAAVLQRRAVRPHRPSPLRPNSWPRDSERGAGESSPSTRLRYGDCEARPLDEGEEEEEEQDHEEHQDDVLSWVGVMRGGRGAGAGAGRCAQVTERPCSLSARRDTASAQAFRG